jgi:hypothetical protein
VWATASGSALSASDHPDPDRCAAATCQEPAGTHPVTRRAAAVRASAQESERVRTGPDGWRQIRQRNPRTAAVLGARALQQPALRKLIEQVAHRAAGSARAGGRSPRPAAHPCPGCTAAAASTALAISSRPRPAAGTRRRRDRRRRCGTRAAGRWTCAGGLGEPASMLSVQCSRERRRPSGIRTATSGRRGPGAVDLRRGAGPCTSNLSSRRRRDGPAPPSARTGRARQSRSARR